MAPKTITFVFLLYTIQCISQQSPLKLWDRRFAGDSSDMLYSIARNNNGNLFLGGMSNSKNVAEKSQTSKGGNDYWAVKTDSNGNKIWDVVMGSSGNETFYSI